MISKAKMIFKRAWVFDFDDTIVRTDAKIHVYKNGRRIKSLTPEEYNFYKKKPDEILNMDDFSDARIILSGRKIKMWSLLERVYKEIKMGYIDDAIYILTARSKISQLPIHTFLRREGIDIPLEHVISVGNENGQSNTPEEKEKVLRELDSIYDQILFYDDSYKNIKIANQIPGIKTKLVEENI